MDPDPETPEPKKTLVANVRVRRFHGEAGEVRSGTKHFTGGAKVTYVGAHWGMGAEEVMVIGQHRGSKKLITLTMPRRHLHNWRIQLVYSPQVLRLLEHLEVRTDGDWDDMAGRFNHACQIVAFVRPEADIRAVSERLVAAGHDGPQAIVDRDVVTGAVAYCNGPDHPIGIATVDRLGQLETWLRPDLQPWDLQRALTIFENKFGRP